MNYYGGSGEDLSFLAVVPRKPRPLQAQHLIALTPSSGPNYVLRVHSVYARTAGSHTMRSPHQPSPHEPSFPKPQAADPLGH